MIAPSLCDSALDHCREALSKCSWLLSLAVPRAGGKQLMGQEKVL